MGIEQSLFRDVFMELWHEAGYGPYDRNELCGFYHAVGNRKLEIIWYPERPTCQREVSARQAFRGALEKHDTFTDGQSAYFTGTTPIMGHAALKLFGDDIEATMQELRKVAIIRELNEISIVRAQNTQKTIG